MTTHLTCEDCGHVGADVSPDWLGDDRCPKCQTSHDEAEGEAAYERSLEDYYGGSSATDRDRMIAAQKVK